MSKDFAALVIATSEPSHVERQMAQVRVLIDSRTIQRVLSARRITSEVNIDGELIRARGDASKTFPLQYLDGHTRSAGLQKPADLNRPTQTQASQEFELQKFNGFYRCQSDFQTVSCSFLT